MIGYVVAAPCFTAVGQTSEWRAEREKQWATLSLRAGKPVEGLILEARPSRQSVAAGESVSITLSVKNVSRSPIVFAFFRGQLPGAWVCDEKGVPSRLTEEGNKHYGGSSHLGPFSFNIAKVGPGDAFGFEFPLTTHFSLDKPGVYRVLLSKPLKVWTEGKDRDTVGNESDAGNKRDAVEWSMLIAKPVTIGVRSELPKGIDSPRTKAQSTEATPTVGSNEPTDRVWKAHSANAGKSVGGRVLEVIDCPLAPGKAELLVSLVVAEPVNVREDGTWMTRADPSDYRILVRNSFGQPVAPLQANAGISDDKSNHRSDKPLNWLRPGWALGAMIPLWKHFDLKQPGEYWVLVSLPSARAGEPDCVAEPIKVQFGADPPALKR